MNFESFPKNNSEKKEEKKSIEIDTRKAALFGAAMMASVGATELHAAEKISSDTDSHRIEMASTDHNAVEDVAAINFMDAARDFSTTAETAEEEKGKEKIGGESTKVKESEDKEKSLEGRSEQLMEEVFDAGFPMGKADLSPQERLNIKNDFAKFAASIPQEVRDNPQKYKVVIEAYASKHKIAETGVDTGKRGRVSTNKDLALFRAQEALEVWNSIEQGNLAPQGIQVSVETSEDGVYHGDLGAAIQEGRMIKISIQVIKESPAAKIVKEGITALGDLSNVSFVIIDRSPSMKSETKQVEQVIKKFNENTEGEISVMDLETEPGSKGCTEDHILSLEKALDNISEAYGEEKLGFLITDEFQNKKYEDSEARVNNLIAKAKSLNIKLVIQRYQDGDTHKFSVKEITPLNVLGKIKKTSS